MPPSPLRVLLALRVALVLVILAACAPAQAQTAPRDTVRDGRVGAASPAGRAPADTARQVVPGVPLAPPAEGGLDEPVSYTARDSVYIEVARRTSPDASASAPADSSAGDASGDVVTLYGETEATYRTATITAARLQYSDRAQTIRAEPAASDSGDVGVPSFTDGSESFTGRLFTYNLATRRGRVSGARTQIQDGFLLGGVIKQFDAHVIYAQNAAYTTCALDHPHYALEAGRLKVVDGRRVYTGPVRLRLLGLAVPFALPFGYFPAAEGRRSGPLPFRYGRETGYGLFLDNVGWYWAASDYLDAQVSGKIGTEGSFDVRGALNYNRRYAYRGSVNVSAGRLRQGESTDPGYAPRVPTSVRWNHQQEILGGPQLSASVNLQSVSQRLVADAVNQQVTQATTSTVALQQSWPRVGRSLSLNAQAYQDFVGNRTTLTLPTARFAQQRLFPFKRGRDEGVLEKISLSYDVQATNTIAYSPLSGLTNVPGFFEALFDAEAFRTATGQPSRFDTRVEQSIPLQASYSVPRFNLSLTPSLQYTEYLTSRTAEQTFDAATNTLTQRQVGGVATARRVAATVSASTELFGTFGLRAGPVDGVRHVVRPNASFSFEPDYRRFGFVREVQADTLGRTIRYATVSGIPTEPTRTLSFDVDNAVLVRLARPDSTGEVQRRTVQVLSLSLGGGVNFAAPDRPVRDVTLSATSQLFGASARLSAGYSAYALDNVGNLTADSYLADSGRPLRLTSVSGSITRTFGRGASGAFGGAGGYGGPGSYGGPGTYETPGGYGPQSPSVRPVYAPPTSAEAYDPTRPLRPAVVGYVDTAAPLSFALDFTAGYRPAIGSVPAQTTATLTLTQFDVRLTSLWTASGRAGLDLTSFKPTSTQLSLRRDLHCWEMAINWQPIGLTRGFAVSLYVKSGYLRDILRLDAPRTIVRNPLGGFNGR